jgi:hypothetical protein
MNAPNFPLNPVIGQRWQQWMWNGVMWVCAPATGVQVLRQVFLASGTYMPSPGLVSAQVLCLGAGGGGGCAVGQATYLGSGGGGGSGALSSVILPGSVVLGGVAVTVGVGGLGGIAPGAASAGSATSFGALCVAQGGLPGNGVGNGTQGMGDGGAGGPATGVGDILQQGMAGDSGNIVGTPAAGSFAHAASGGVMLGGNNRGPNFGAGGVLNGAAGHPNSGAGGSGGAYNETTASANGGNGATGVCTVIEYCWADVAPNEDCGCPPGGARIAGGWQPHGGFDGG